ncbi:MAG: hypothetical protein WCD31_09690 [Gillisia sp.]
MFFVRQIRRLGMLLFLLAVTGSCVKDVDISQSQEITLNPDVQLDLLIFDVNQDDFIDPQTKALRTVVHDTVRLEFLDDDYVQQDLQQVELKYKYLNTFSQAFYSKVTFLSENDHIEHVSEFFIGAGSNNNPAETQKTDLIPPSDINSIKRSIKMAVEIEVQPNNDPFEGELKFQSKGLFSFQF